MTIPHINGYFIFDQPAATGAAPEKVAINFKQGTAVKTNGPNNFVLIAGGQAVNVILPDTLDNLLGAL